MTAWFGETSTYDKCYRSGQWSIALFQIHRINAVFRNGHHLLNPVLDFPILIHIEPHRPNLEYDSQHVDRIRIRRIMQFGHADPAVAVSVIGVNELPSKVGVSQLCNVLVIISLNRLDLK